jgi:hypothetical protein
MAPWIFNIKFPYDTEFIFQSLMFTTGDDESLELLTQGLVPKHLASVYGISPYYLADPSTPGGACLGLNPHARPYYPSVMTSQGRSIRKTILQPLARASSSSSSRATPDRDSVEDYLEIGGSACWNHAIKARRINMVGPARAILRIAPDFSTVRLQTIME